MIGGEGEREKYVQNLGYMVLGQSRGDVVEKGEGVVNEVGGGLKRVQGR